MSKLHRKTTLNAIVIGLLGLTLTGSALAQPNTEDTNPIWSPDGDTVLYYSYRDGTAQLYALSPADGSERRLTQTETFEMFPAPASPDGTKVVFVSDRDGAKRFQQMEIYLMDLSGDGNDALRLTHDNGLAIFPAVSPDGRYVAYTKAENRFASADIWLMSIDGTSQRQLTDSPGVVDRAPRWSPDGRSIVFDSNRDGDFDVYLLNIDGGEPMRLTDGPGYDALPSFSPDGSRIVFESSLEKAPNGMTPPPGADICTIALDGSDYRCLTHEPDVYEGHASWSPSGNSIVFHSLRHGRYKEIYIMAADGTDRRRLTHTNEETVSR